MKVKLYSPYDKQKEVHTGLDNETYLIDVVCASRPLEETPTYKLCNKCNIEKSLESFHKKKTGKYGVRSICKECRNHPRPLEETPTYKLCNKCNIEKPLENFHKRKTGKYGLASYCKSCTAEYDKNRKFSKEEREHQKEWRENNKKKQLQYHLEYKRDRKMKDPLYKLTLNSRALVSRALSRNGFSKKSKTHEILGCSYSYLLEKLEDNPYGFTYDDPTMDIDHIIPLASAKNEITLLRLLKVDNLQLLPSEYNRHIKSDKWFDVKHFEDWLYKNYGYES